MLNDHASDVKKKPLMPVHGGTDQNNAPVLAGLWVTLIKEAAPSKPASYFSKSQKTLNKVAPKIVKENVAKFESSFENKMAKCPCTLQQWPFKYGKVQKCSLANLLSELSV